jgi:uncharacterized cupredoxin-like copper-binding protein
VHRRRLLILSVFAAAAFAGCGSATTPLMHYGTPPPPTASPSLAPSASPAGGNTASLSEWKVQVASTLAAGKSTIKITNAGAIPHELLVFKSDKEASAYPLNPEGGIIEEGGGVTLVSDGENVEPGGSQVRVLNLSPGKYLFVCNIPGHFKAGMFTVVTVGP